MAAATTSTVVAALAVECSKLCSSLQSVINSTRNLLTLQINSYVVCPCVCIEFMNSQGQHVRNSNSAQFLKFPFGMNSFPIVCAAHSLFSSTILEFYLGYL